MATDPTKVREQQEQRRQQQEQEQRRQQQEQDQARREQLERAQSQQGNQGRQSAPQDSNKGIKVRATRRGTYPNDVVHERGDVFVIKDEEDFSPNWMVPVNQDTDILAQPAPGVRKGERLLHSGPLATRPTPGRLSPEETIDPKEQIKRAREQAGGAPLQPGEIANETTPNAQSPDQIAQNDVGATEAMEAAREREAKNQEQRKPQENT